MPLLVLLVMTACSRTPEKEIVTVPTVVENVKIDAPVIQIVKRPNPVTMKDLKSSDYEHLITRFDKYFGKLIDLER